MKQLFILAETNDGTFYCVVITNNHRNTVEYLRAEIDYLKDCEGYEIKDIQTNIFEWVNYELQS